MAVEGVMMRDGNSVAGADLSNTAALAGPSGRGSSRGQQSTWLTAPFCCRRARMAHLRHSANKPKLGEAAMFASRYLEGVYGATVCRRSFLTTDASGRLVTATTGHWLARRRSARAAGDIQTVLVLRRASSPPVSTWLVAVSDRLSYYQPRK